MHALIRWHLLHGAHARAPFAHRPDRARRKAATAVRADVEQLGLDAVGAKRAFVGADACLGRRRRQVLVAIFAVRPELQCHDDLAECIISQNVQPMVAENIADREGESPSICAIDDECQVPALIADSGSLALSLSRSSTIEERTWATLWCGISTLLTMSDRLLRSRSTTLSR